MTPEEFLRPGEALWWGLVAVVVAGRACDLFSTWLATPTLALEANPIARRLGWKFGLPINLLVAPAAACWPLLAISISTTSVLVAARNFQNAWLMRSMGERGYRMWFTDRLSESPPWLVRGSFLAEAFLTMAVGAVLMRAGIDQLVPAGIGLGITAYGFAVAVFTTLALRR